MIDKLLYSQPAKRILAIVMVCAFLLGSLFLMYPASRRTQALQQLGGSGVAASASLTTAMTVLAGPELQSLSAMPETGSAYKRLSGLLTNVAAENRYERIYMVYKGLGGSYYTLLDSAYRDTGVANVDYYAPGAKFTGESFNKLKGELDRIYRGKGRAGYLPALVLNAHQEHIALTYAPMYSTSGQLQGVLICEIPAGNADFNHVGPIDLNALAVLSYSIFALSLAALIGMNKWRKARESRADAKAQHYAQEMSRAQTLVPVEEAIPPVPEESAMDPMTQAATPQDTTDADGTTPSSEV